MFVVVGCFPFATRPGGLPHRMRVIEAYQALVVVSMQCYRIIEAMRPLLGCHHHCHLKLDPIPAFFVENQNLTIEIEERIQAGIALTVHHSCYHILITHHPPPADSWPTAAAAQESLRLFRIRDSLRKVGGLPMLHESISIHASEEVQIAELCRVLKIGVPALVGPGNERLELPESVYRLLRDIVENMQQGRAVTLVPEQAYLTTQKAADILGVSRPHVVKLLDSGEIPSYKTGSHRRVCLKDVVAYVRNRDARRKTILDEIARDAFSNGLYDNARIPAGGDDE